MLLLKNQALSKASNLSNLITIDRRDLVFNIINLSKKLKCLMVTTKEAECFYDFIDTYI